MKETRNFKINLQKNDDGTYKLRGTPLVYDQRSDLLKLDDSAKESLRSALAGTPIVYGKESEFMGFYEFVKERAAREALKTSDARLLYGHNGDSLLPMGRQSAGTLRMAETKKGVEIEADPPRKNPFVDALTESIERGDIREMSFGFVVEEDEWKDLDTDTPTRTIVKLREIFDVSYVTFAAYPDTSAAVRSLGAFIKSAAPMDSDNGEDTPMDINAIAEEDELYRKLKGINKEVSENE